MVEGNDVWISVLVLVVRLLTLLGSELIQTRGSSEEKHIVKKISRPKLFRRVGWRGVCATVRGEGSVMREEVNFQANSYLSLVFGNCHRIKVNFLILSAMGKKLTWIQENFRRASFGTKKLTTLQYNLG